MCVKAYVHHDHTPRIGAPIRTGAKRDAHDITPQRLTSGTRGRDAQRVKPGQKRLCWLSQSRTEKRLCIRHLNGRESEYILLMKPTLVTLKFGHRDLTNRVNRGEVCGVHLAVLTLLIELQGKGRTGRAALAIADFHAVLANGPDQHHFVQQRWHTVLSCHEGMG
jgi:hypothetical protein